MYPQRPTTHLFVYLAAEMIATNIEEKQRTSSWPTNHSLMAQAAVRLAGRGKTTWGSWKTQWGSSLVDHPTQLICILIFSCWSPPPAMSTYKGPFHCWSQDCAMPRISCHCWSQKEKATLFWPFSSPICTRVQRPKWNVNCGVCFVQYMCNIANTEVAE